MKFGSRFKFLLLAYFLSLFIFTDARVMFFLLHKGKLGGIDAAGFFASLFFGLRFDIVAVTIINSLFIFLVAFPVSFFHGKIFRVGLKILFVITNVVALLANMIDLAYFPYTLKRTTADAINFLMEKNDAATLLPVFLKDFWYLIVIFIAYIFLIIWLYKIIERKFLAPYAKEENTVKAYSLNAIYFLFIAAFSILGIRGGTQLIPLGIIDAGYYVKPQYVPLVLNTPFCLIKSGELFTLEEKNYMSEVEAQKLFNPFKKYSFFNEEFKNYNVVVIIVESLSKEYTKIGGGKSYTPFLDSLMNQSLVYTNTLSNGKRSIEGIPAVVASLPSFQYDYISTVYCNNRIMSLASILKTKGYYSSFFHGGTNGTMNFNGFCANAGFDKYFGRSEYNNEMDYDGDWGIWDEPFLQRMAIELGKQKEPFVSAVFTLNSHHPYQIPEKYKGKFPEGTLPIHKCVGYADNALKLFFQTSQRQKWFSNTLFVITGDHTGVSEDYIYSNMMCSYRIPLFFYLPNNSLKGVDDNISQQTDVMPTVLSMLKYNEPFFSFGNNLLDSSQTDKRFATSFYNISYQYFSNEKMIQINGDKPVTFFNYRKDPALDYNLIDSNTRDKDELEKRAKAFIQQYNNRIIHNKTTLK